MQMWFPSNTPSLSTGFLNILMDFNGFDDVAPVFSTMKRLPAVLAGAVCTCKYCFVFPELRWRSESGATGRIRCFWCRGHCPNWGHYRALAPLPTCYTSLITWTQPGKFWCNLQLHLTTSSGFPETGHGQGCKCHAVFQADFNEDFQERSAGLLFWSGIWAEFCAKLKRKVEVWRDEPRKLDVFRSSLNFAQHLGARLSALPIWRPVWDSDFSSLGMSREMLEKRIRIKCEPILMCNFCSTH